MRIRDQKWLYVAVMTLILPVGLYAQSSGKVAILNLASAMEKSMEGKQAIADFQAKLTSKQNEMQKKSNEIEEMQKQLQTQGQTLSDDARATLARKIEIGNTDLTRAREDAQKEFGTMQQEIYGRLGSKMMPIIEQYAKENNISMILDPVIQSSQVIYFDPSIEITDDIVKRYDAAPAAAPAPANRPAQPATRPAATPVVPAAPKK
jgi:outer membrane protein